MGTRAEASELGFDELKKVVDEYRKKISQIVQDEEEKARVAANQKCGEIVDAAWRKAETIVAEGQQRAQRAVEDARDKANAEAARIIEAAKSNSEQILKEADSLARKEAKNRIRREVDKLLDEAKKESEDMISQVKWAAEREAAEITTRAKKEAEQISRDAREAGVKEAHREAAQIIAEGRHKAEMIALEAEERSQEVNRLLEENVKKAESLIQGFRQELALELETSSGAVKEVIASLRGAAASVPEPVMVAKNPVPVNSEAEDDASPRIVDFECEVIANRVGDEGSEIYAGAMELKVVSAYDIERIVDWKDFLVRIPNFRFVSEMGYENGLVMKFTIVEPVRLMDVLKTMPLVQSVITEGDNIRLMLRAPALDALKMVASAS